MQTAISPIMQNSNNPILLIPNSTNKQINLDELVDNNTVNDQTQSITFEQLQDLLQAKEELIKTKEDNKTQNIWKWILGCIFVGIGLFQLKGIRDVKGKLEIGDYLTVLGNLCWWIV